MATIEACGSDGLIPSKCGPCSNVKKDSEATMFCVECNNMLCDTCVGIHRMFPAMKSHKIVVQTDKEQYEFRAKLLTDRCEKHDSKHLETFCKHHKELCCSVCVSLNHRNCDGLVYLPEYVNEKEAEMLTAKTKQKLEEVKIDAEKLKSSRQTDRQRIDVEKAQSIKEVDDYRERLFAEIDRTHGNSISDIESRYNSDCKSIENDVEVCDNVIAEVNEALKTLHDVRQDKVQSFIGVSRVEAIKEHAQEEVGSISGKTEDQNTAYQIEHNLETEIKNTHSFGKFVEVKYDINIGQKICDLELQYENKKCDIQKVETINSQQLMIADYANKSLMITDKDLNIVKSYVLPYHPSCACVISDDTVCVSFQIENMVQIVSLLGTKHKVNRTFDIGKECRGVCYKNGNLYVACGGGNGAEIQVYSTDGTLKNTLGKGHLSAPYYVNTNQEGSTVFVGDNKKGVIAIRSDGTLLWTYNNVETLKNVWDIAVDENNDLYVCGFVSHNIVKVSSDGQKGEVILKGIKFPQTICYDRTNKRLIIYGGNMILVHEVIKQRK
ncbi:uncharacterized protein LOC128555511 [Mercenaria mercenaria]|uniref:uncharacterized protein LOC128555511 n=1 Tax=Mercenaria mercenaria TaxID=6596 RepID=UPI00234F4954|nr:uncharacterized protein LOC128555511 [Mercenaria mercenaria]